MKYYEINFKIENINVKTLLTRLKQNCLFILYIIYIVYLLYPSIQCYRFLNQIKVKNRLISTIVTVNLKN